MKRTIIIIFSMICIFVFCSCNAASKEPAPEATPPDSMEEATSPAATDVIPTSLIFTSDGKGGYLEPVLGEWNAFLAEVFKSFDTGEVDPGSGNIKYYGEGNDGYGYCFIVTTRNDSTGIISYNIDTALISVEPNSGGDEVSGQDMVRWMYDNFHN